MWPFGKKTKKQEKDMKSRGTESMKCDMHSKVNCEKCEKKNKK